MANKTKKVSLWAQTVEIYQQLFEVLRKDPTVWAAFVFIGILDAIALTLLFLAPSPPVSKVLAPIIRTFWDDKFLHYPLNFMLLPKLFNHAHFLISTTFGLFMSAIVIQKIEKRIEDDDHVSTVTSVIFAVKKYIPLLAVYVFSFLLFAGTMKLAMAVTPPNFWLRIALTFVIPFTIQIFVAFLIPSILLHEGKFLQKVGFALKAAAKKFFSIGFLILVPMLLVTVWTFFKLITPYLIKIQPELVLWVLASGVAVITMVDFLVTSTTAILFLKVRNQS